MTPTGQPHSCAVATTRRVVYSDNLGHVKVAHHIKISAQPHPQEGPDTSQLPELAEGRLGAPLPAARVETAMAG
jgi:hypothetical protein